MSAAKKREPVVPLLMQRKKAAEYLGLSTAQFYRLEQSGAIPAGAKLPGFTRGTHWHRDQLAEVADRWAKRGAQP